MLAAALVFLVLRLAGVAMVEEFVGNSEIDTLAYPTLRDILMSVCGAIAGMIMIISYREYLIPGALIALEIIEATAIIGVALAAGEPAFVYEGVERLVLDSLLIVVGGVIVVLLKQALFHPRAPIV